jgi:hypothetical protein
MPRRAGVVRLADRRVAVRGSLIFSPTTSRSRDLVFPAIARHACVAAKVSKFSSVRDLRRTTGGIIV